MFARWFDEQFDENIEAVRQISKSNHHIESWWEIFTKTLKCECFTH